jgi:phosphoglucomutase/phosphomannomutase
MHYCYKIIDVEFPERGFLLFWQLPLEDKLRYFEIEEDIVKLSDISDLREKEKKLNELLAFLGANPVEKINNAFKAKYGTGILAYLGME